MMMTNLEMTRKTTMPLTPVRLPLTCLLRSTAAAADRDCVYFKKCLEENVMMDLLSNASAESLPHVKSIDFEAKTKVC